MSVKKRLLSKSKDESGAAIIFVLGVMMVLLIVSTSTLVAAGNSAASVRNKQESNQLNLYAEGMQKSLMYCLQATYKDEGNDLSAVDMLGAQIIRRIYQEAKGAAPSGAAEFAFPETGGPGSDGLTMTLQPKFEELSGVADPDFLENVDLKIEITIRPTAFVPPELSGAASLELPPGALSSQLCYILFEQEEIVRPNPEDPLGADIVIQEARKETTTIDGMVEIKATAALTGGGAAAKTVTSLTRYTVTGVEIEGDSATGTTELIEAGDWRFISYETVDH